MKEIVSMKQLDIYIPYTYPSLHIQSNDSKIIQFISANFLPYVESSVNLSVRSGINLKILNNNDHYIFQYESINERITYEEAIRIINRITRYQIKTQSPFLTVHCAVLSNGRFNYLLIAPTGMGKSTLSAFLSKKGYQYYTDDKVVVNCEDKSLHPFYKPIHLRLGGKKVLEEQYNIAIQGELCQYGCEERYCLNWLSGIISNDFKFRIVFINRGEPKEPYVKKLSVQEALHKLIYNLVYVGELADSIILALRLVTSIDCFDLHYKELDDVERLISLF